MLFFHWTPRLKNNIETGRKRKKEQESNISSCFDVSIHEIFMLIGESKKKEKITEKKVGRSSAVAGIIAF